MKNYLKYSLVLLFTTLMVLDAQAQRPNMQIKARFGGQFNSFVEKRDTISADYYAGFQGGFAFRVSHKKKMFELGFDFVRNYIDYNIAQLRPNTFTVQLNSFEIPLTAGYRTYKNPIFKHFVYGGFATVFNIKSLVFEDNNTNNEAIVLKPKDSNLRSALFSMRFGMQFDFYMFNFDINYNIGLNNATKTNYRVQAHRLNFVLGVLF